jgi:hypothetical protein
MVLEDFRLSWRIFGDVRNRTETAMPQAVAA